MNMWRELGRVCAEVKHTIVYLMPLKKATKKSPYARKDFTAKDWNYAVRNSVRSEVFNVFQAKDPKLMESWSGDPLLIYIV